MLSLQEAKEQYRCRICGERINVAGCPVGFQEDFGKMLHPLRLTLNFGEEFAHTDCLETNPSAQEAKS